MKTDLFQCHGHCWVFQICWHIEWSIFTASSSRIWNSSTGIPSPPLTLFVVMLPKVHTWLIILGCLALGEWSHHHDYLGHEDLSVQFFCVFVPPLLNIFCLNHTYFVLCWAHLCMTCSLGISNFLEEIPSLSHSIVFLYFFALITEEAFLISPCYSLELWIQMGVSFLFSFAFCFPFFIAICKASSGSHFAFLHFFFLRMVLIPISCTMSQTSVYSSSGTLSIRSSPLNLFLTSTV